MNNAAIVGLFAITLGLGFAASKFQSPQKSVPKKAAPQAAVATSPTRATIQAANAFAWMVPTVPEFQAFGQIHVNGQVAYEIGYSSGPINIGGVNVAKSRLFRTQTPNQIPIEVHRDILTNGKEFSDPAAPGNVVAWWAVLLDAQWQPQYLSGTDYNCAGGGFNVTP